jgi:hypothetical protein
MQNDVAYQKLFSVISGHFLTQALPDNWIDLTEEELEEWFVECTLDIYEYLDWEKVYDMVDDLTKDIMEVTKLWM